MIFKKYGGEVNFSFGIFFQYKNISSYLSLKQISEKYLKRILIEVDCSSGDVNLNTCHYRYLME